MPNQIEDSPVIPHIGGCLDNNSYTSQSIDKEDNINMPFVNDEDCLYF